MHIFTIFKQFLSIFVTPENLITNQHRCGQAFCNHCFRGQFRGFSPIDRILFQKSPLSLYKESLTNERLKKYQAAIPSLLLYATLAVT